jgi:hypothetical protein
VRTVDEQAKKCLKHLRQDMGELKRNHPERVWYSFENGEIESASELVFRQFNVEHKGNQMGGN